jgi:hypothetical protein
MTDHGIIAPDWQIKAAADENLGAILFPLLPEPVLVDTADCQVSRGMEWRWITPKAHATWGENEPISDLVLKYCGWAVSDRLFFQEEWCKGDWGAAFDDDIYFTKSGTPEAENIGWQPANTMPPEAAQYWFEVTGVRVIQMDKIDRGVCYDAGLIDKQLDLSCGIDSIGKQWASIFLRWSKAFPSNFWDSDRWAIVLDVKVLENNNA